jgi:hypothetical protein
MDRLHLSCSALFFFLPDENHPAWKTRLPTTLACLSVTLQLRSCTAHGHKGIHATLRQHSILDLKNTRSAVSVSETKIHFFLQYSLHFHIPVKTSTFLLLSNILLSTPLSHNLRLRNGKKKKKNVKLSRCRGLGEWRYISTFS